MLLVISNLGNSVYAHIELLFCDRVLNTALKRNYGLPNPHIGNYTKNFSEISKIFKNFIFSLSLILRSEKMKKNNFGVYNYEA